MPTPIFNVETRIKALNVVLADKGDQKLVGKALTDAGGDWSVALKDLKKAKLSAALLNKLKFAHSLAELSDDNVQVVKALVEDPKVTNLRDMALQFNLEGLTKLVNSTAKKGSQAHNKAKASATILRNKLFTAEPTAVLQRMVQDAELPIANKTVRAGIGSFLNNQPDFNIRTTSVYTALKHPDAFNGIADEHRSEVIEHLKTLQRVQAISPIPAAVPVLMKANLTSAFRIAEIPESTFLSAHGPMLGVEAAKQVYTSAINAHIRNEHALMTMREAWRGTGLAIIDGQQPMEERMAKLQGVADEKAVPLNLEALFGSIDFCECEDCLSVYSPAAYFVEILQYLRNNNLDPDKPNTGKSGIEGTPLKKLFRRRPDLGCLELTCENTFTVLPYIDLVNEVMESFVVHLDKYHTDPNVPKQATLEVFNVLDETTSELLASPQHINYQAYCILKDAVYPFTLPYHQPIDVIRIWLKYLGTSRYELLDTFLTATETVSLVLTPAQQQELQKLHARVLDRSADAEFLGITQEEHIILTREAFWPKAYFDFTLQKVHTDIEYQQKIGVRPVPEYFGYIGASAEADMLSIDETSMLGLTFVKKQFLPRTGIQYIDLVELLKTRFINPAFPQGRALAILESIRFSYRFLQTLVVDSTDPKVRFAQLIEFLNKPQTLVPQIDTLLHPDPCHQQSPEHCLPHTDFHNWVYCYFERIGKLIVLEFGEGPKLPIEGKLVSNHDEKKEVGRLRIDGSIVDTTGKTVIGHVGVTPGFDQSKQPVAHAAPVLDIAGKPFVFDPGPTPSWLWILDDDGNKIGRVDTAVRGDGKPAVNWLPTRDTCNLDKVRLTHLDGSVLSVDEYDRMQRFIRLWHKLGWTIAETDLALIGTASSANAGRLGGGALIGSLPGSGVTLVPGNGSSIGFDVFQPDCSDVGDGDEGACRNPPEHHDDSKCPEIAKLSENISTDFLHQLVAIRKLLDLTGLPLDKLLSFWADINTAGEKSLYSRLFLTHNLLGIDKVFKSDANGNYLTQAAKLSDHMPVVMAALKIKADDVTAIVAFPSRPLSNDLTLDNVSALYRHSLLAKILHVPVADLAEVFNLFVDPFTSAENTLALLRDWGNMEDAGFTFRQLNYLIQDHDDPKRPLAPAKKAILQISKTLYDGLNAIDQEHKDVKDVPPEKKDEATADLIRAKAGLLYEPATVEKIIGLLEGTTVYTTNAPVDPAIVIPETFTKLKYSMQKDPAKPPGAAIQVTGILTDTEKTQAKTFSNNAGWAPALDRVGKQAQQFFNDNVFGIFSNSADAIVNLLAGDINVPPDPNNPAVTNANTALGKRFYFLKFFLPFLRQRLAHRLIVSNLSGAASLPMDVTDILLSDILWVGASRQPAIDVLEQIHQKPAASGKDWKGYLIPTVDGAYTFAATSLVDDKQPPDMVIDGQSIPFTVQQLDPTNVWFTAPVSPQALKSGQLYWLEVKGQPATDLQWRTSSSPKALIPASVLLPDYSSSGTKDVFIKLFKAALVVNGFNLTVDEVSYWQGHAADFDGFDFNAVTLQHWRRLQAYASLRDKLPKTEISLLGLFQWANKPDATTLSQKIAEATQWEPGDIGKLIAPEHFDLNRPDAFRNEVNLLKLQKALQVAAAIGTDIDRLFAWANPVSRFSVCHQIAEGIRATLRARYDQEDWEQVVKPLNDQLREDQKQALISYLLVQPDLIDWGVVDADSLFEFFLIDVQMDACMETSRIKQAISTVQLFVQRCMLGLEAQYGVATDVLSRSRWEWMQKYRVWEANRKVFLYPENWIKSELRDDKSLFYKELEAELLQKDISPQTVEDALRSYLFKVDQVANLKVVGLFLDDPGARLHVFARTRNAPHLLFYRYFHTAERNWYPWEKVQVDIPSYDAEAIDGKGNRTEVIVENGTYLIPVVWRNRLLIFFPQFVKKTVPPQPPQKIDPNKEIPVAKPVEGWEIKLAWSEYRNGKWTQKSVTTQGIYSAHWQIELFTFLYKIVDDANPKVIVEAYIQKDAIGAFHFTGSQLHVQPEPKRFNGALTDFHYIQGTRRIHSLRESIVAVGSSNDPFLSTTEPFFEDNTTSVQAKVDSKTSQWLFSHPFVHELLGRLGGSDLGAVFSYYVENTDPGKPAKLTQDPAEAYGQYGSANGKPLYNELKRSNSLYNWEAVFHVPMQLADRLLKAQQFDLALKMCHYVMNPYAKGTDDKRFWQFVPFKEIDATNVLENLFLNLQSNTPDAAHGQIDEWRNKPFQPHTIARSRPSAYMKWVAMKYIEILVAYGDYYFRQNTLEAIPLAIQCYVLASHCYGPRAQKIPKRGKIQPQTYNSLLDKWDAFGNAMVELELVFPFSNQTSLLTGSSNGVVGLANVFGFASTLYFCIPDNPQLQALRNTIDDRLFKIRHCEDIDGVIRHLPLFEPPIDPALLVQAAAQGLSLSSVLNDLNSPMPNYRFAYLLQKALELCSEVKSLGNAFLSVKEKGDAEALSQLRARHESSIHKLVLEVKNLQLDEAAKALEALQQSRKGPVYRLQHYLKLIGEDLGRLPDGDADFSEVPDQIEQPVDESGLKLIAYEKEELDKASAAADWQTGIGIVETLASVFHALPTMHVDGHPLGIGLDVVWGFPNLANATQAAARGLRIYADHLSYQSSNAGRKAGFLRQLQDRIQQANVAGYEVKNIDKQMLTQQIRISMANQELRNQQQQIDNALEVEEFLRNKYTNQDLYSWMDSQIRTLYHQAYNLAYDLAKRVEKVFRFERGLTTSSFIQYGYWDAAYDGLFSGERLYTGLKQLEAAHQEKRGHDFEVSKSISLRQINPKALIDLKETGTCEFALPEVLFDMDYPGHYLRRLKSVSLRIPCILGAHTSLNCTLRLLEHKFRINAIAKGKSDYPEHTDQADDRFSTVNVPISSIAVSSLEDENGVFELNFHDERYLPFEGAGVISKWRIELPSKFKQFDYDTITDVVMRLRYTSVEGGDKLKAPAADSVQDYIKSVEDLSREEGLFAVFDLKNDFPNEWYNANHPAVGATERVLTIDKLNEKLPVFTKGRSEKNILAKNIYLFVSGSTRDAQGKKVPTVFPLSLIAVTQGGLDLPFTPGESVGTMNSFVANDVEAPMGDFQITIHDMKTVIDKMWLVERYVLA
ncbi:neuraminidase-like domain-containing protein [Candidatus Nitrotoga arctica]|uniref:Virulence plasmid A protein n=1 Tax=Candidatus Nitrotoga arctica TaxID=453162 RepID=A0ABN8AH05_9PROT|nr:neuraminidase-like domain-containing protein [Candidatus Nitrotoga arctica]CAG9932011.1 Virulence plasmid A protein [Candidatus Nitrotoga arctica]